MAETELLRLRTTDLDEAVDAVTRVYCPHSVRIRRGNGGLLSELNVQRAGALRIVDLKYSAPVHIDASFDDLLLLMSCTSGSAHVRQGRSETSWAEGQTVPLSPGLRAGLDFDADFAQRSLRVDLTSLDELCARRLGHRLDGAVRFALQPFSPELESRWQSAMNLASGYDAVGIQLPAYTSNAFNEFLLSLLLDLAPHNYVDELRKPGPLAAPRVVREAERLMRETNGLASVHDIAAAVAVSVRSLEAGFREWKHETSVAFMRRLRLEAARDQLSRPDVETTVTNVALKTGFLHVPRFAQYYRSAFNEHPSETLRQARKRCLDAKSLRDDGQ
jgi:AraC-like DNA-binding protein